MPDKGLQIKKQGLSAKLKTVKLPSFFISFAVVCLCFLGLGVHNKTEAATYYVDATGGSDSNTGTATNQAWQTLGKVNSASLSPGDSVLFKRGEVWKNQYLNITWSGSSGNPITFADYGSGNLPIFNGGNTADPGGWSGPDGNGVYSLDITGINVWGLAEDNVVLRYASNSTCSDGNWYMSGNTLYYKPTSGTPSNHTVDGATVGQSIIFASQNNSFITIRNIKLFLGVTGIYGSSVTSSLHDIIIENCQFDHNAGFGINLKGASGHGLSNITIRNSTFNNDNQSMLIWADNSGPETTTNILITNNIIQNTGYMVGTQGWTMDPVSDSEAIGIQNFANSTISNNEISGGAKGGGISTWINSSTVGATGNQITKNYIHDILGAGIITGGEGGNSSNESISYNVIESCGQGSSPPYGGLRLERAQSGTSQVYNNTIKDCDNGILLYFGPDNYILKNNLVSQNTGFAIGNDSSTIRSNVLDYNLYYPDGSTKFYGDGEYGNFANWKAAYGQDSHSLASDPYLVAGGEAKPYPYFYPRSYSPVINAGTDVGLTKDYLNVNVPQGAAPDIGAFEYTISIPENIWFFFPLFLALPRLIFLL